MSAFVNEVTLIGNLGRDPESKGKAESPIAMLTIATTRSWKDRSTGEKREETEWHRVVAYQGLAKIVLDYAKKGRQVYVKGFLRTRKWTDEKGQERFSTEIVAESVQLLGANPHSAAPAHASAATAPAAKPAAPTPAPTPAPAPIAAAAPAPVAQTPVVVSAAEPVAATPIATAAIATPAPAAPIPAPVNRAAIAAPVEMNELDHDIPF